MFISVLELFKIGIGPSSSHTVGPMVAAGDFIDRVEEYLSDQPEIENPHLRCTLKGSLAFTGKGHATDRAVALGLHGYSPVQLTGQDVDSLV
ncbi:MAG: serine dehydratase beta chain, partial [Sedimenticola sp.]